MIRSASKAVLPCLVLALAAPARAETPARRAASKPASPASAAQKAPAAVAAPATPSSGPLDAAPRVDVPLPPPPPGTARVAAAPASRGAWLGLSLGAFAAFDRGQSVTGQIDYGIERTPPGWSRLQLEWHLVAAVARPSADTELTRTELVPGSFPPSYRQVAAGSERATALVAEIAPTARLRYPVVPGFALFADGGAGIVQTIEKYQRNETFVGTSTTTKNVTGLSLRAALGLSVDLGERTRLVFEPVAFDLLLGTDYSAFTPNIGVAYRL
jgi:hypothetical protein